jgi:hypothetical protein
VLGLTLVTDHGDVACCEGLAHARAEQRSLIQALDRRRERTPTTWAVKM